MYSPDGHSPLLQTQTVSKTSSDLHRASTAAEDKLNATAPIIVVLGVRHKRGA